jgi:oxygen-independent coproporphyrinogen III oxidase
LEPRERALEVLVFGLRRSEGVDHAWFEEKTGMTIDSLVGRLLQPLVELKLIADDERRIRLTRDGVMVSDSIFSRLLTRCHLAA